MLGRWRPTDAAMALGFLAGGVLTGVLVYWGPHVGIDLFSSIEGEAQALIPLAISAAFMFSAIWVVVSRSLPRLDSRGLALASAGIYLGIGVLFGTLFAYETWRYWAPHPFGAMTALLIGAFAWPLLAPLIVNCLISGPCFVD